MELERFINIGLPLSLGLIMLSMGMTLRTVDFKRIATSPKAFFVGITAQMLLVPLLALLLLQVFHLPPLLAVGLLILSFSPGGTTSNLFSYMAKGDVALSIALTTVASFITPFSIPFLTELALQAQLGENTDIVIPVGLTMKRLLVVTIAPVLLGMALRAFKPVWADNIQPVIHKIAVTLFLAVIFSMIFKLSGKMPEFLPQLSTITSVMIILAMLAGYAVSRLAGLNPQQLKTNTIEVGMQNGGMALIVTQGVLNNPTMSLVPVIYGLIMLIPVILFVFISRRNTQGQGETTSAI
jgi:BASS family bile acid:Na+ symporter